MTENLFIALVFGGPAVAFLITWIVRRRSRFNAVIHGTCARCGYTTASLPEDQPCPECEYPIGRPVPEHGRVQRRYYLLPLVFCAATYSPLAVAADLDPQSATLVGFVWGAVAVLQIACTALTNGRLPPILLKVALAAASITVFACGMLFIGEVQEIADGTRRPWQYGRQSHIQLIALTSGLFAGVLSLWVWSAIVVAALLREVRRRRFQQVGMHHMPAIQHASAQSDKPRALSEVGDGVHQGNE